MKIVCWHLLYQIILKLNLEEYIDVMDTNLYDNEIDSEPFDVNDDRNIDVDEPQEPFTESAQIPEDDAGSDAGIIYHSIRCLS